MQTICVFAGSVVLHGVFFLTWEESLAEVPVSSGALSAPVSVTFSVAQPAAKPTPQEEVAEEPRDDKPEEKPAQVEPVVTESQPKAEPVVVPKKVPKKVLKKQTPVKKAKPEPKKKAPIKPKQKPEKKEEAEPSLETAPSQAAARLETKDTGLNEIPVITSPAFLSPPRPPGYPRLAKRRKQEGSVLLELMVGPDGKTQSVSVLQSSGYPLLDEAAVKAARQWKIAPRKQGGRAVLSRVHIPIDFKR